MLLPRQPGGGARDARLFTQRAPRSSRACRVHVAQVVENMGAIIDAEPVKPLLEALETSPPLVQREAARALGNLSANIEYGDTILREGAQPHLIALLRSDDQHCQRMAAMALCNLASNIRNQPKMLAGSILEPVVGEVGAKPRCRIAPFAPHVFTPLANSRTAGASRSRPEVPLRPRDGALLSAHSREPRGVAHEPRHAHGGSAHDPRGILEAP